MRNRRKQENNYFRSFGTLSNDSVVTDIYNKRLKNKKGLKTKAKKCTTRKMTEEEYEKYFGKIR